MQRLLVYQSLWAMERLPGRSPQSLEAQVAMIAAAGFDGISAHYTNRQDVERLHAALNGTGLKIEGGCFPRTVDDLRLPLALAAEFPVTHINIQADIRPRRVEDCLPLLDGWMRLAEASGIPVYIETHRGRMTSDLHFTLDLLERRPDLPLLADLSHVLVSREFAFPPDAEAQAGVGRLLGNAQAFHGRVAGSGQVQLALSFPHHRPWVDLFLGWWEEGFRDWRARSDGDAGLVFTCELGPPPYAITGRDGGEATDRWAEALLLRDMVRGRWEASAARPGLPVISQPE